MSYRSARTQLGPQEGMVAEPPASPLQEAAAAAATAPFPAVPDVRTDRRALEQDTSWLPSALQPAGMVVVGMAKAAWALAVPVARVGYRLLVWSSPVLLWALWKYVNWYLLGWLHKALRILKWGTWVLSFFTKTPPTPAA